MSTSTTFNLSPFASNTVTHLDRVLHHDQRGGERTINGKPSYTVEQAADEITRDNSRWHDTNGDGKTDVTYQFRTTAGPFFRALGLSGFSEFNQAQKDSARQAMDQWSDVANVRFTEQGQGAVSEGNINFGNFNESADGKNAFATTLPSETTQRYLAANPRIPRFGAASEIWLAGSDEVHTAPSHSNDGHRTTAHELGHALARRDAALDFNLTKEDVSFLDFLVDEEQIQALAKRLAQGNKKGSRSADPGSDDEDTGSTRRVGVKGSTNGNRSGTASGGSREALGRALFGV